MSIKLYGDEEEDDLLLGEQKPGLPDRLLHLLRKEKSAL